LSKSSTSIPGEWVALPRCALLLHLTILAPVAPMEGADWRRRSPSWPAAGMLARRPPNRVCAAAAPVRPVARATRSEADLIASARAAKGLRAAGERVPARQKTLDRVVIVKRAYGRPAASQRDVGDWQMFDEGKRAGRRLTSSTMKRSARRRTCPCHAVPEWDIQAIGTLLSDLPLPPLRNSLSSRAYTSVKRLNGSDMG
jgi:hypothetical protein